MPLYQYIKATPKRRIRRPVILSFFLMGVGGGILLWVAWPIISFTLFSAPLFGVTITPIPNSAVVATVATMLPQAVLAASPGEAVQGVADYTNANLWYPTSPQKKVVTPVNSYKVSIPKLKIEDAMVTIAGDDLNKSLIHYGGTGLPGEYGNAVVFGHSVLPQFFNRKDYRTMFSTLPTLAVGDDIFVTYDGITYKYKVYEMVVRDPGDLAALEQKYDDSYLTLITCVPPGTLFERLNVKARLVRI